MYQPIHPSVARHDLCAASVADQIKKAPSLSGRRFAFWKRRWGASVSSLNRRAGARLTVVSAKQRPQLRPTVSKINR
jgi:hypothetical protein